MTIIKRRPGRPRRIDEGTGKYILLRVALGDTMLGLAKELELPLSTLRDFVNREIAKSNSEADA